MKSAYSTLQSHDFEMSVTTFDYTHLEQAHETCSNIDEDRRSI